ncbi:MAG: endolytic transglycosylase MltG [Clostridia bacterium]|nr:endolytic transglycosylase MltG [Clostridia bacterium]
MAKKRKKKIKQYELWILIVLATVIALYAHSVWRDYRGHMGGATKEVVVETGNGTADIAQELVEKGIIKKPFWFRVMSKLGGHDGKYLQGVYTLPQNAGYKTIFKTLESGYSTAGLVWVTIPEGYELRQIADKLEEAGLIDRAEFYKEVENGSFDYWFLKGLPERENRLEGYLFPDTYQFRKGDSEAIIINTMLKRFDEVYTEEYKNRAKELSMTDDQVITLASVIEREAMGDADRKLVAGVFHNRLKSDSYPYLQSCATVQYILKERKTVLSIADTKIDSPYNTYQNPGLPIGPIASPGLEAIEAALYPTKTDYLFFVLDSQGVHRFAKTYDEHQRNMQK